MKVDHSKIVDLSNNVIPNGENFLMEIDVRDVTDILPHVKHPPEEWYVLTDIHMNSHCGTHIEFPYHHEKDGLSCADYPLERMIGNGAVMDFSDKKTGDWIEIEDLKKYEHLLKGDDIVLFRTGLDVLLHTDRWTEEVHLRPEALLWLIDNYHPGVIGTDAAGFEIPEQNKNHTIMFERNIGMIESATNLKAVQGKNCTIFVLPTPVEGVDAMPIRLVAVLEGGIIDG